ncbi:hypothetical protein ACSTS3_15160 [Aquimarina muelleri]|uniref:hypothetical protein n=1 Tax=Aquimarina muelleri TaxID=279356 RepID=UPI003F683CD5
MNSFKELLDVRCFSPLFYFLLLFSGACTDNNYIEECKERLKEKNTEINVLKAKNAQLIVKLDEAPQKSLNRVKIYEDLERYMNSIKELSSDIVIDNKQIFQSLFDNLIQESSGIEDDINLIAFRNNFHLQDIGHTDSRYFNLDFLDYLREKFNRNPETIRKLFSQENKEFIYSLFENNDYYQKTGLEELLETLILTYRELENNDELFHEVYEIANIDKDSISQLDYMNRFQEIISNEVKIQLKTEKNIYDTYTDGSKVLYIPSRSRWVYTFWIRRKMEKNDEIIIKLLEEFKLNLNSNG